MLLLEQCVLQEMPSIKVEKFGEICKNSCTAQFVYTLLDFTCICRGAREESRGSQGSKNRIVSA